MGQAIHCRRRDGQLVYRVWSTVVDDYVSEEMDEAELDIWTQLETIEMAVRDHKRNFPDRLDRAEEFGSSMRAPRPAPVDIDGPWQTPIDQAELAAEDDG